MSQDVSRQNFSTKNLELVYLKTAGYLKSLIVLNYSKKSVLVKMAKIDEFGGPAHLAWTPLEIKNLTKTAKNIEILDSIRKIVGNTRNSAFQAILLI